MTLQQIETTMTTIDMTLVEHSSPWDYKPGEHYLAVSLQEMTDHACRTLQSLQSHKVAMRYDLVGADEARADAMARLSSNVRSNIGKTLRFQVNARLKREVLDKHPVIAASTNKFGVVTAGLWPRGFYAVRLTFGFDFKDSIHIIDSLAVDAKPTSSVGSWELTPDYFV